MTAALAALRLVGAHWRVVIGGLGLLVLGIMLASARSDARHWHKEADRYAALFKSEHLALKATEANYRAAAKQAEAEDAANKARVERDQSIITQEVSHDYQERLAALRARYDAVRVRSPGSAAAIDPGGPTAAGLSEAADGAGGPDATGPVDPFACEANTLQLTELQAWVRQQSAIPVDSP